MNKILCTICARGGSKGVKNKNVRLINNKPLIAYTIEQALMSAMFEHVVVSTDSNEIANCAVEYGAEVFFKRSSELATDTAGKLDVIRDAFIRSENHFKKTFDVLIDLDATSPLRAVDDIANSYQQFFEDDDDNLITASPSRRSPYFNLVERDSNGIVKLSKNLDSAVLRRQDAPETYDMNASIYIWKRDVILNSNSVFLNNTGLFIMPEERSIDIDSELDFTIVSYLLRNKHVE